MNTAVDPGEVSLFKRVSNMPSNKAPVLGVPNPLQSNIKTIDGFNDGIFFAKVKPQPVQQVEIFNKNEYKKDGKSGLKGTDLPKKFSLAKGLAYEAEGDIASNRISQITAVNRALRMFNNPTMAEYLLGRKLTPEELMAKSISLPKTERREPSLAEALRSAIAPKAPVGLQPFTLPAKPTQQDILNLRDFLNKNMELLTNTPVEEEKKSSVPVEAVEAVYEKSLEKKADDIDQVEDAREAGVLNYQGLIEKIENSKSMEELSLLAQLVSTALGKENTDASDQVLSAYRDDIINFMSLPASKQLEVRKALKAVGWDYLSARRLLIIDFALNKKATDLASEKVPPASAISAPTIPVRSRSGKEEAGEDLGPPAGEPPITGEKKRGRPRLPPPYVSMEIPPNQLTVGEIYGYNNFATSSDRETFKDYRNQLYNAFVDISGKEGENSRIRKVFLNPNTDPETLIAWFYAYNGLEDFEGQDDQFEEDIIKIFNKKVVPTLRKLRGKKKDESGSSSGAGIRMRFKPNKEMPEKDVEFVKDRLKILMGSLEANNRPNKRLVDEAGQMVQYLLLHKAIPKKLAVSVMNKVVKLNSK